MGMNKEDHMEETQSINTLPPISEWKVFGNKWVSNSQVLSQIDNTKNPLIESPQFNLYPDKYHIINIEFSVIQPCHIILQIVDLEKKRVIRERHQHGSGFIICSLGLKAKENTRYKIKLYNYPKDGKNAQIQNIKVGLLPYETLDFNASVYDTFIEHWGIVERSIHALCKKFRHFNSVVSYIEMQLGRTEILSLPSFVALCPTGQCNANCLFCSVAENRDGIVKTFMPKKIIENLIYQIGETVWMFGIEGNGEPLLYKYINEILATIISKQSKLYLITNGSLLNDRLIYLLSSPSVDSINFSINAATQMTHTKLMGLRNLDKIKENIRKIAQCRGTSKTPFLSISIVVNSINIHEVTDFIRMAESLNIDRVLIRPLSEIATSEGTVEDLRSIVPFENDIRNLKENIADFISDVAPKVEVIFDYSSFKAVKTNPLDGIIPLQGFENQLIAPNRRYWHYEKTLIVANWHLNALHLQWNKEQNADFLSEEIPVRKNIELRFPLSLAVYKGEITVSIEGKNNKCLYQKRFISREQKSLYRDVINVNTKDNENINIRIHGTAGAKSVINFEKLRAYPERVNRYDLLKNCSKWEKYTEGLSCICLKDNIRIEWEGQKFIYLLKSYSIPCYRDENIKINTEIDTRHGVLGIGVLSGDGQKWISTSQFCIGYHKGAIQFNSGENDKFQIILYSNSDEKLVADVRWRDFCSSKNRCSGIQPDAKKERADFNDNRNEEQNIKIKKEQAQKKIPDEDQKRKQNDLKNNSNVAFKINFKQYFQRYNRKYCQKPWTDLSNFSVDGRMDVCCITTGESQRKYALGNLFENGFQEIWNGPVAQKFRKTVNDDSLRLPPCTRCPMAYQKQGLFFSLGFTKEYIKNLIKSFIFIEVPLFINYSLRFPIAITMKIFKKTYAEKLKK